MRHELHPAIHRRGTRGVTLMEMLVVALLISLVIGLTLPSATSGLDSIRLRAACDNVASFLNRAVNRSERRQEVVEIRINKEENAIWARSTAVGFVNKLPLEDGVTILAVLPAVPGDPNQPRSFLIYPGGNIPRFGLLIANRNGVQRIIRVDPLTGVPQVEVPAQ